MIEETAVPNEQPQDELKTKTDEFVAKYGELVAEYKLDFASYPSFIPDGQGGFRVIIQTVPVDVSNRPEPSPFMEQN